MQQAVVSSITLLSFVLAQYKTFMHIGCYATKASKNEMFFYAV
jgi:hypothetical protein